MSTADGSEILYRIPPPSKYPEIMDLLYHSFFADEPMTK